MTSLEVLEIVGLLTAAGVPIVLSGGWGVDALAGRQTRVHADLDVAVPADRFDAAKKTLSDAGFSVTTDWLPGRLAMTHPDGREVDLHPLEYDAHGHGVQRTRDGASYVWPASELTTGTIAGTDVPCISAALQVRFHEGYELGLDDRHDLDVLARVMAPGAG